MPKFATNFRFREHAAAYFGLMADAIRWCGYRGWVILIDEVELLGRLGVIAPPPGLSPSELAVELVVDDVLPDLYGGRRSDPASGRYLVRTDEG